MPSAHPFQVVARFLQRFGEDVEGREHEAPSPAAQKRLRQFAQGKLSAAQRVAVTQSLAQNPAWLEWLAGEVKLQRPKSTPRPRKK